MTALLWALQTIISGPSYPYCCAILKAEQRILLIVPQYDIGRNVCLFIQRHEYVDAVKKTCRCYGLYY